MLKPFSPTRVRPRVAVRWPLIALIVGLFLLGFGRPPRVDAQSPPRVQVLTESISLSESAWYRLPNMQAGDTLYITAQTLEGNFDPFLGLSDRYLEKELGEAFSAAVNQAVDRGQDPVAMLGAFASEQLLAWDDDGGPGYAAALTYAIPRTGDYWLLVTGSPFHGGFGRYRLTVGINEPAVLDGEARPGGEEIAFLHAPGARGRVRVQELGGELTAPAFTSTFDLHSFDPGDEFYVFAEPVEGDFRPILVLSDFGDKPVATGNAGGAEKTATLQHVFDENSRGYQLSIIAASAQEETASGKFRLLVGVNAPEVLEGRAESQGDPVLKTAIPVKIGLRLQQISDVDQKAENYEAVVTLRMEWVDPSLAFSPDTCACRFKVFTGGSFNEFLKEAKGHWPEFTLFNQQGNRWVQNRAAALYPDGRAIYLERFTTTFQAPDFNFKQFPFDMQHFFIRVDSLFPTEFFVFQSDEEFTQIGDQLGEEEWYIIDSSATVSTTMSTTQATTSRYSFDFNMRRHLNFYIFRIFIPLLLIILVSWITFFLKDYNKRVDVTSANLLLFIAFNFTISDDLPRLGYLTYLDTLLTTTFAISVFVVLFNVALKRLEQAEKTGFVQTIDNYTIWLYPVAYVAAFGFVTYRFFGPFF